MSGARLAHVALLVRDYDEAIAWFTQALGFRVVEDTPLGPTKRWVVVAPPDASGATLLLARAATAEQEAAVGRQGGGRVWLFLHTDDFRRDHAAHVARGVRFVEAPREEAYGTVAVFEDLYGNRWDLIGRREARDGRGINPRALVRRRVLRDGDRLVDGPFSIRPPRHVDDYGWLECQLRLTHRRGGVVESAAVYVDESMNREEDFLPPLIRHLWWDRGADGLAALAGEITWPRVDVRLSHFEGEHGRVDALIRAVQTHLRALPFVVGGLSADRSLPDAVLDERGSVELMVSNGLQHSEHASRTSADAATFDLVLDGIATLRGLGTALALDGWRESHAVGFGSDEASSYDWWDYRSPGPAREER